MYKIEEHAPGPCEKHCDIIITDASCVLAVIGVDNIIIDSQSASIYPSSVDVHTQTILSDSNAANAPTFAEMYR